MMKECTFEILENGFLNEAVSLLVLGGDTSAVGGPGQFVSVQIPGFFLRRPFSVLDCDDGLLTLAYQRVGAGTEALHDIRHGQLNVLTGLGTGFDLSRAGERPLLVGGGMGFTPLYYLAKSLPVKPRVLLGFQSAADVVCADEFKSLGVELTIVTEDGFCGEEGLVSDFLPGLEASYFYACGPEAMLRAVCGQAPCDGEFSLEARMGCGFGACMGCSVETVNGPKRVCRDGPVFRKEELVW